MTPLASDRKVVVPSVGAAPAESLASGGGQLHVGHAKYQLTERLQDPFPHSAQGRSGPPLTLPNLEHLLRSYGISVRYDVIKKKLRITIPGHSGTSDNADNTAITVITSLATLNGMATGQVPAFVAAIADTDPVNPAADWIKSKRWDGVSRLPEFCETLVVREGFPNGLKCQLMIKWLQSATAAALLPSGFKTRGVLTLQGPQGIGKTSWVKSLIPEPLLQDALIKVDHLLDPNNKDTIIGAITHWIVELGELDSSFKRDVARLKGVLTNDYDKVRRPYAKAESEYPRRTVFCATVNEGNFLVDHTGNTRWWTLPVVEIDFRHGIDMQQVFAELAVNVERATWWLTPEEEAVLEQFNGDHRTVSLMRERLLEKVDPSRKPGPADPSMGTTAMLSMLGYDRPSNPDAKELTSLLRELLGPSKKVKGTQTWRIPLRDGGQ